MDMLWIVVVIGVVAGLVIGYFVGMYRQKLHLEAKYKAGRAELNRLNIIKQNGTRINATVSDRKVISRKANETTYILLAQWYGSETRIVYSRQEIFTVNTKYVQTHKVPEIDDRVFVLHVLGEDPKIYSYIERP